MGVGELATMSSKEVNCFFCAAAATRRAGAARGAAPNGGAALDAGRHGALLL
jgi:hypothetical protein